MKTITTGQQTFHKVLAAALFALAQATVPVYGTVPNPKEGDPRKVTPEPVKKVTPAPAEPKAVPNKKAGASRWPQITKGDLAICRSEVAAFHKQEIEYWHKQARDEHQGGDVERENRKIYLERAAFSARQNDIDWYIKGNGSCNGTDYPCYGLEVYNEPKDKSWVDIFRSNATGKDSDGKMDPRSTGASTWPNGGEPITPFERTEYRVNVCIAKIFVAKYDGKPLPAPSAASAAPEGTKLYPRDENGNAIGMPASKPTVVTRPNGNRYEGEFDAAGKYHGRGVYTWANGSRFVGQFNQGNIWAGQVINAEGRLVTVYENGGSRYPTEAEIAYGPIGGSGAGSKSGSSNSSSRKPSHNPAADASSCVKAEQNPSREWDGNFGNWHFTNNCNTTVEIFWCFEKPDGTCSGGGTWAVQSGMGYPAGDNGKIVWGACRGRDGGGFHEIRQKRPDGIICTKGAGEW